MPNYVAKIWDSNRLQKKSFIFLGDISKLIEKGD